MRSQSKLAALIASPFKPCIGRLCVLAAISVVCNRPLIAQSIRQFQKTFQVSLTEPVSLDVYLADGQLQVAYSREGQVSISATAQIPVGMQVSEDFLATLFAVEKKGNRVQVRQPSQLAGQVNDIKVSYRLDVPYRTEVHSFVGQGNQSITGILGPVRAETSSGDIKVSYVSKHVFAQTDAGSLDLQVIGERLEAKTGRGDISCVRAAEGVSAETGEGDISLMVVGPSEAIVKTGTGRIDAAGVRGTLVASTSAGNVHVKAVPHDNWDLHSVSGSIRVELPPNASFEINATTNSGELLVHRDDIEKPQTETREFHRVVNGGGKHIQVRTGSGRIVVS